MKQIPEIAAQVYQKKPEFTLYSVEPDGLPVAEDVIRSMLEACPFSYEPVYDVDSIMAHLYFGRWKAWLYMDENNYAAGGFFTSISAPSEGVLVMVLELAVFENFFQSAQMYHQLEEAARKIGCDYMEGIVTPTFAEYAYKKLGYKAIGVSVRKPLSHRRRN